MKTEITRRYVMAKLGGVWCVAGGLFVCDDVLQDLFCLGRHRTAELVFSTDKRGGYPIRMCENVGAYQHIEVFYGNVWVRYYAYTQLIGAVQDAAAETEWRCPLYVSVEFKV